MGGCLSGDRPLEKADVQTSIKTGAHGGSVASKHRARGSRKSAPCGFALSARSHPRLQAIQYGPQKLIMAIRSQIRRQSLWRGLLTTWNAGQQV
jgi:hypothetical protein